MNRYAELAIVLAALTISFTTEVHNGLWFTALSALVVVVAVEFRTWWADEVAAEQAASQGA
ncbi:hypothetical protein GCM10011374_30430 [Kocuria dechangensis]|uniref:Uncharacterized protein n=1 Tax=Kocuria dechangensis TaxID=1176249 RepID=A0A917LX25_9MICC|nr:hypothetical protein [Kocuria dechangensis]GGG64667.1 hypothetical protein GCM10011374_30430 [Kocuria dechangensis]